MPVSAMLIAALAAVCVFAGGLAGMGLRQVLPENHLSRETQEVVRLGSGMVSVLASLVLGLLIATAKSTSDTADHEMRAYSADLIMLDRALRSYGAEADGLRARLRHATDQTLHDIWPARAERFVGLEDAAASTLMVQLREGIRALVPAGVGQRELQAEALQTATALLRQRWLLIEQAEPSVRPVVLVVLLSWIVAILASFGLNAPRNATVVVSFLLCALTIGGAIFLVLEMDSPLEGILRVSSQPMRHALAQMTP